MRRAILLSLIALAGCGPDPAAEQVQVAEAKRETAKAEGRMIPCSRTDEAPEAGCEVERGTTAAGPIVTVRHADGGFRRFRITDDGRGVIAADGADRATVALLGKDRIAVTIAGERFELPATVGPVGQNIGTPANP